MPSCMTSYVRVQSPSCPVPGHGFSACSSPHHFRSLGSPSRGEGGDVGASPGGCGEPREPPGGSPWGGWPGSGSSCLFGACGRLRGVLAPLGRLELCMLSGRRSSHPQCGFSATWVFWATRVEVNPLFSASSDWLPFLGPQRPATSWLPICPVPALTSASVPGFPAPLVSLPLPPGSHPGFACVHGPSQLFSVHVGIPAEPPAP